MVECGCDWLGVKFAVKDYQEALNMLESVAEDASNKTSAVKWTNSSQLIVTMDSSSFSVRWSLLSVCLCVCQLTWMPTDTDGVCVWAVVVPCWDELFICVVAGLVVGLVAVVNQWMSLQSDNLVSTFLVTCALCWHRCTSGGNNCIDMLCRIYYDKENVLWLCRIVIIIMI